MKDISFEKFSSDYLAGWNTTCEDNVNPKANWSLKEVSDCWKNDISFIYKDERTKESDLFVLAKPDGSEYLIKLKLPVSNGALASEADYVVIQCLNGRNRGLLYQKMPSAELRTRKRMRRRQENKQLIRIEKTRALVLVK
ncbi:hypothetical protein [Bacteroides sp. 224]|uniref:hypothetical protein n=1 Tax=Bacteroides sp. 224 TaxID=2302936 RepID=UPI0013D7E02D|nr:hypothetical protein [Bacteroides sp. 224]NDV64733.1 hypothetical protein [Bacteroides sp. 224]